MIRPVGYLLALLCVLLAYAPESALGAEAAQAVKDKKAGIVLMPLRVGKGISSEYSSAYETAIRESLSMKYIVYSGKRVEDKIQEVYQKRSAEAKEGEHCDETRCLQDIAIEFQSELLATASISKSDAGYMISLNVINIMEDKTEYSKSEFCEKCSEGKLIGILKKMAMVGGAEIVAEAKKADEAAEAKAVAVDSEPPTLTHQPLKMSTDVALAIKAVAVDNSGKPSVAIGYRKAQDKAYIVENMTAGEKNSFTFNIPAAILRADAVEYYLEASDPSGNKVFSGKPETPHAVTIERVLPYYEGMVIDRKTKGRDYDSMVLLNIGSAEDLKKDDILTVISIHDRVVDPVTKEVLQIRQALMGKIKVLATAAHSAAGIVLKENEAARIDRNHLVRLRCGKVYGLTGSSLKIRQVELNWKQNVEPEATGYAVYRAESPDGPFNKIKTIEGAGITSFTETDSKSSPINDQTKYYYQVAAINDDKVEGMRSDTFAVLTKGGPNPPTGFKAASNEVKQITLAWGKSGDPDTTGYIVQRADVAEGPFVDIVKTKNADDQQAVLKVTKELQLEDGKKYYFRIASYNKAGKAGNPSPAVEAYTRPKPQPPSGLKVVREFVRSVGLSWDTYPEKETEGFNIYRKGKGDAGFKKVGNVGKSNVTAFTDSGKELGDEAVYEYCVTVLLKGVGESGMSEPVRATTFGPPVPPEGLEASVGRLKEIVVKWKPLAKEDVAGYEVFRSEDGEKFASVKKIAGREKAELPDKGKLEDGKTYYYRVASYNGADVKSAMSAVAQGSTKPVPARPSGLTGTKGEVKQTHLGWLPNAESDIREYVVWRSDKADKGYSSVGKAKGASSNDVKLGDGATYYYRVTAVDKDGLESVPSESISITTKPLPLAPSGVRATATAGSVSVTWGKSPTEDVVKYNVYVKGTFSDSVAGTTDGASFEVTKDIKPDKSYAIYVKAVDKDGLESVASETVKVTTPK